MTEVEILNSYEPNGFMDDVSRRTTAMVTSANSLQDQQARDQDVVGVLVETVWSRPHGKRCNAKWKSHKD